MVTIGTDSHKSSHTLVAADCNGREVAQKTVQATSSGHLEAARWARQWPERVWALEDCRQLSRRLESDLLATGEKVLRVPPKLMAGARRSARTPGKSDPIDALAVARAALREPNLPAAQLAGASRELRLLIDRREDLVGERTRCQNQLRWHLVELEPEYEQNLGMGALTSYCTLDQVRARLAQHHGLVARIATDLVEQIRTLTGSANELEKEIGELVVEQAPALLAMPGCGALTAAKIVGETAGVSRFRSRAAFARHNGTAPIPVWSGNDDHHRLNRGGNRQLNAALHRIAITQLRVPGPARAYVDKRLSGRDNKRGAIRLLRRRLSDEVYRRLLTDERALPASTRTSADAA